MSRVVSHDEWEELRRERSNLAETEKKTENKSGMMRKSPLYKDPSLASLRLIL